MFDNLNSKLKKVVVIFLIITLTYANLVLIGTNIVQGLFSYALEETEEQDLVVANQELVMNKVYGEEGEQKRVIQIAVETGIESEEYPIKTSTITLGTDLIEGTLVDVKVTELNKNSYTTGTWEISEEGKLIVSLVNGNETLEAKEKGLDKFLVTYVFENSEVETIKQPLERIELTTFEQQVLGYVCMQSDFFEEINVEKELSLLNMENKDIHKTTIESGKVDYTETLNLDLSYRNDATNITIEDVSNDFYNIDEQQNEEVDLKYNKTVLNKEDLSALIGETGKLVITDNETSKELIALTKEKLAIEESEKQYYGEDEEQELRSELSVVSNDVIIEYSIDVACLKMELIDIVPQSNANIDISDFVIKNTKSILNVNDIENLSHLQENVKYVVNEEKTAQTTINFKDTITRADLTVDNTEWIVGEVNTVNYTITLDTISEKSELFKNPMFLIELPSSVESINTANSEFTVNNDGGAFKDKKVFTTTVLGSKFVVIVLNGEQTNKTIENGNTCINLKLELNIAETTNDDEQTKLYYQNNTVTAYESGKSFDTAQVTVDLIIESEPKEDIKEEVNEEQGPIEEGLDSMPNLSIYMNNSTDDIIKPGQTLEYNIYLNNYNLKEHKNLEMISILPEGVSLQNIVEIVDDEEKEIQYNYDEETREISIVIDRIEAAIEEEFIDEETGEEGFHIKSGYKVFKIVVKANPLEEGIYSKQIKNSVSIEVGENKFETNEVTNIISDAYLLIEAQNIMEQINENEEIVFEVKIANKGLIDAYQLEYSANIPEDINLVMVQYGILGETEYEGTVSSNEYNQELIEVPAEKTYFIKLIGRVKEIDETKSITATGTIAGEDFSWSTNIVNIAQEPNNPETPGQPNEPGNSGESENPSEPSNPTEPEGPSNPENPEEPSDSTAPEKPDILTDGFDLSLMQYLNKVTVENAEGRTVYEYTDTNFAKVEIHSKHMNGSKITFEYKIIVKNQGTIPGYARKIVNYKPEGLEFNQDLNKDWYVGDDGNIYSVALIDKLLNPGETAELTMFLTKQMTNENGGTIKNTVELYEASNDENVEDINSIPGDKLEGQNDMSIVEVIVAVKTGTIILYITLATAVIAIIGLGFYKIKKVTLNKKGGC